MTARLDQVLQKYPDHEEGIRALAARDPSGNLKYLGWSASVVASGQALAQEVADVVDLFHKFAGQRYAVDGDNWERIHPDIYSYKPKDLAKLRDALLKFQSAQDAKRKERERLYHIDGDMDVDVVHEDADLVVRHIKNKAASAHYGLGTKWCISMLRESYFENYEVNNATFFFFERKVPKGDDYDKMALMVPRGGEGSEVQKIGTFTAADEHVNIMKLAKVHGTRVFDIFRAVYEASEKYPGSAMYMVSTGAATEEQLRQTLAHVTGTETVGVSAHMVERTLESICCNDAAPWSLLDDVFKRAKSLVSDAWKRALQRNDGEGIFYRRRRRGRPGPLRPSQRDRARLKRMRARSTTELTKKLSAALAIHPNTPVEEREKLVAWLRRRHIDVATVERAPGYEGHVGVHFNGSPFGTHSKTRHRRRLRYRRVRRGQFTTVKQVLKRADVLKRKAATFRKRVKKLVRKIEEANAKKAARKAKKEAVAAKKRAARAAKSAKKATARTKARRS